MSLPPEAPSRRSCAIPADVRAVGAARRFATDALDAWGRDDLVDAVALLVSEVVTNLVLHAGTSGELEMSVDGARVRVEVRDGAAQLPQRKAYGDDASTGRGLVLVELLADAWGADRTPEGKCVWFEVGDGTGDGAAGTDGSAPPPADPPTSAGGR